MRKQKYCFPLANNLKMSLFNMSSLNSEGLFFLILYLRKAPLLQRTTILLE